MDWLESHEAVSLAIELVSVCMLLQFSFASTSCGLLSSYRFAFGLA
jgi:hypothetical protein